MDAAEKNHVGLGGLRLVGEAEGIAHIVCDLLDRLDLVVVREDDGVALAFEGERWLAGTAVLLAALGDAVLASDGIGTARLASSLADAVVAR